MACSCLPKSHIIFQITQGVSAEGNDRYCSHSKVFLIFFLNLSRKGESKMFFPSRICVLDTKAMKKPSGLLWQEVLVRQQQHQQHQYWWTHLGFCVYELPDLKLGFLSALWAETQQDCKKKMSAPDSKTFEKLTSIFSWNPLILLTLMISSVWSLSDYRDC